MLLADEPNIREVIAFPMNQRAEDPLMQAPAPATEEQLKTLSIKLDLPRKGRKIVAPGGAAEDPGEGSGEGPGEGPGESMDEGGARQAAAGA